jgi:hypothetical protein
MICELEAYSTFCHEFILESPSPMPSPGCADNSAATQIGIPLALHRAPAFVLVTLHGMLAGTDASQPWLILLDLDAGALFAFLIVLRFLVIAISNDSLQPPV